MRKVKNLFDLDIQYFADDGENNNQNGNNDSSNENGNGNDEDQNSGNDGNNSGERTFTQTQVSNMMTKEKNEGKKSVLKALGFKTEDEAKKAIEAYNAFVNSQLSDEEKNKKEASKLSDDVNEQTKRAEAAENKLLCFMNGVNKDSIDDVLAIASTKVTENKGLDKVLSEMKKDNKYSSFFESSNGSNGGTGSQPGHNGAGGSGGKSGSYGKSLAERSTVRNSGETKSNFF